MFGPEHIHGYKSAEGDDIVFVTVNSPARTLHVAARVKKRSSRLQVSLSAFETPDGEYVHDYPLATRVQKWVAANWSTLTTR